MLLQAELALTLLALLGIVVAGIYTRSPRGSLVAGLLLLALGLGALPMNRLPLPSGAGVGAVGAFSLLCIAYGWASSGRWPVAFNPYVKALACVVAVVLVWLPYSAYAGSYGGWKTGVFMLRGVLPALAILALGPFSRREFHVLFGTLVFVAVFLAVRWGLSDAAYVVRTTREDETNPIMAGRTIGMGVLICTGLFLFSRKVTVGSVVSLAIAGLLGFAMLWPGSRGPVLALIVAVGATCVLGFYFRSIHRGALSAKAIALGGAAVILGGAYLTLGDQFQLRGVERVFGFYGELDVQETMEEARVILLLWAWEGFRGTWGFGMGTGGFAAFFTSTIIQGTYPHNIFAEFAAEQGVAGLAAIGFFTVVVAKRIFFIMKLSRPGVINPVLCSFWIFTLMNAMVSGDIGSNSEFWIASALLFVPTRFEQLKGMPQPGMRPPLPGDQQLNAAGRRIHGQGPAPRPPVRGRAPGVVPAPLRRQNRAGSGS
jgi:hypothetical protein